MKEGSSISSAPTRASQRSQPSYESKDLVKGRSAITALEVFPFSSSMISMNVSGGAGRITPLAGKYWYYSTVSVEMLIPDLVAVASV